MKKRMGLAAAIASGLAGIVVGAAQLAAIVPPEVTA